MRRDPAESTDPSLPVSSLQASPNNANRDSERQVGWRKTHRRKIVKNFVEGTVAAGRLMAALLFGLAPTDTWTIALATARMVLAATIAGYFPARRASRVDPAVALHHE